MVPAALEYDQNHGSCEWLGFTNTMRFGELLYQNHLWCLLNMQIQAGYGGSRL